MDLEWNLSTCLNFDDDTAYSRALMVYQIATLSRLP
jgi:hypothetical protein